MNNDKDTSRSTVRTYVPAYQREEWKNSAEEMEMSLSEFVRCMVQAGRRGFEESPSGGPTPRGNGLESTLQDMLREEPQDLATITDRLEDEITRTLQDLREEGTIDQSLDGTIRLAES